MRHLKLWLTVIAFLICMPAFADDANDSFREVVAKYLAANPKPQLPEEAHKFKAKAEFAVQQKQFDRAAELYGQALEIAPWWPSGHYNRAAILVELKQYRHAIREMKKYLRLVPNAPDARAVQDKIYQWEDAAEQAGEPADPVTPEIEMVPIPGKHYAIGKYEVTQKQWRMVMGKNPSSFSGCGDDCPVEKVSWDDVKEFVGNLNELTGKNYRLPTEDEWEYACYGGTKSVYCGGNDIDAVAWYNGNSGTKTHPVGLKQANGYGLYDMSGNVWEWTSDCWEGDCARRVLRGGSWNDEPQNVRADNRNVYDTAFRYNYYGFRLARTLP